MAKCKNCKKLFNNYNGDMEVYIGKVCIENLEPSDIEIDRECQKFECIRNGDNIRRMTDEELAEHIIATPAYETCIKFCKNREECCEIMDMDNDIPEEWCKQCLLEWLQKEVE